MTSAEQGLHAGSTEVNVESLGRIPTGPSLRGIKMQTNLEIKHESNKDGN